MFGRLAMEAVFCFLIIYCWTAVSEQFVEECPRTKADWERESTTLQCQEPNYYHCLRDDTGHLLQICSRIIWVPKSMCPEIKSKESGIDVKKCTSNDCAETAFRSNEVFLYPICFITYQTTTTTTTTTATAASTRTTTPAPETTVGSGTTNLKTRVLHEKEIISRGEVFVSGKSPDQSMVWIIVTVILVIVIGALGLLFYMTRVRRRRHKKTSGNPQDEVKDQQSQQQSSEIDDLRELPSEVISEEDSSTKRSCEVYVPDGRDATGGQFIDSTRILVLLLQLPTSTGQITVIDKEAKETFGRQYVHCRTLAYFLKHKQEQQATDLLRDFDFNTSDVGTILKKLHDIVSKSNLVFVLTVPFKNFSLNREEIMSIITKDPDIFKCKID